jgi:hypothetical protein
LNTQFLAAPKFVSNPLSLLDFSPLMRGYIPVGDSFVNPALSHQHTRFVQWLLRMNGIACLMSSHYSQRINQLLNKGVPVRVISDGIRMQISQA